MIVVDTTVLTELFVHETTSAAVERLRRQNPEWAAPDLWRHELICVMWKHIRIGWGSVPVAESAMKLADEIMGSTTFRLSAATVLSTALEFEISTYDAHFVALAQEMNTALFTHDRSLIKKCPEIAKHPEEVG